MSDRKWEESILMEGWRGGKRREGQAKMRFQRPLRYMILLAPLPSYSSFLSFSLCPGNWLVTKIWSLFVS